MKKTSDAKLREGLVKALVPVMTPEDRRVYAELSPKLAGQILERWDELVELDRQRVEAEQP